MCLSFVHCEWEFLSLSVEIRGGVTFLDDPENRSEEILVDGLLIYFSV